MFPITTILVAAYQIIEKTFLLTYSNIALIIIAYLIDFVWSVVMASSKKYAELNSELNFWNNFYGKLGNRSNKSTPDSSKDD